MAKKEIGGTATLPAKAPNNGGGAIMRPQKTASRLEGEQPEDTILPRLHIFQGVPEERKIYGDCKPGDLINIVTGEVIASYDVKSGKNTYPKFVPIFAWNLWIKFKRPRNTGIEYMTRNRADVPDVDLVFVETPEGKKPPTMQVMNWVCLLEGDPEPKIFSFKVSSIKAGQTLNTMEKARTAKGKGFGFYAMELAEKPFPRGVCLVPRIRPAGDPPTDMDDLSRVMFDSLATNDELKAKADEAEAKAPGDFDPNAAG